jgi:hypothetical protein
MRKARVVSTTFAWVDRMMGALQLVLGLEARYRHVEGEPSYHL